MSAHGLIVAAPRSGAGKTTVTLGLLAALRRRGVTVRGAKSGPDYIDPAFHQAACGLPSLNLDSWAMDERLLAATAAQAASGAELLVIESAMGLFDGVAGEPGRTGAAADLAARLRVPVLLVLDVSGQAQSAAAAAQGFAAFDRQVHVPAVLLNRVASERHRASVAQALEAIGLPVAGALPRDESIVLPERHLGLVQAGEHGDLPARLDRLADLVERHCDLDLIQRLAAPLPASRHEPRVALPPPGQRIALAQDAAFTFLYPHLIEGWRRAGAEIVPFSPLADEPPREDCDCCWLPGGYPELHAGALGNAARFKTGLARFAAMHPVHGECGGYMILGAWLEDASAKRHAMTGLLSHGTSFAQRRLHLGYRSARVLSDCALGRAGGTVRGHEFHYASLLDPGSDAPLAELTDGQGKALGPAGGRRGLVTGTFFHAIAADGDHAAAPSGARSTCHQVESPDGRKVDRLQKARATYLRPMGRRLL